MGKSFADQRREELGISEEENIIDEKRKLIEESPDGKDNIVLRYVDMNGGQMTYQNGTRQKHAFKRIRVKDPVPDENGKINKYYQGKNSGRRPYFNGLWKYFLKLQEIKSLVAIEGEFKALCANKHGIPTVGLGGKDGAVRAIKDVFGKTINAEFISELKEKLLEWQVKHLTFFLDADAVLPDGSKERALGFYACVRNMWLACANFQPVLQLTFIHINPKATDQKGLDDLIIFLRENDPNALANLIHAITHHEDDPYLVRFQINKKIDLFTVKKHLLQYLPKEDTGEKEVWEDRNGAIEVRHSGLGSKYESWGYRKFMDDETKHEMVQVNGKLIRLAGPAHLADSTKKYVDSLPTILKEVVSEKKSYTLKRSDLWEVLYRGRSVYFGSGISMMLDTIDLTINRDTREKIFFYFQNGVVEVTANTKRMIDYNELNGYVWLSSVKHHNIELSEKEGDFEVFSGHVVNKDKGRHLALKTAVGYSLSTFKDPSVPRAIVLIDEAVSDNPAGRTGKGLIFEACGQLRKQTVIGGKTLNIDSSFAFQDVQRDTQLLFFDDITKKFSFEWLFSILTTGLSVNQKGKPQFFLPYEISPKIGITSNYQILGEGSSFRDRIYELELYPHYSDTHKPIHEFKKTFFGPQWTGDDWNRFYCFMFECAQQYLKYGLKEAATDNLALNKLRQATCPEFIDYCDRTIRVNVEYDKRGELFEGNQRKNYQANEMEGFEGFQQAYPDFKDMKQRAFTAWLREYAKYKGWEAAERRSSGSDYIKFVASNLPSYDDEKIDGCPY